MATPGELTSTELLALIKQSLGGRNTGLMTDAWYVARMNSAYARLCTFQGVVQAPGMRRPQFRALRFFELYHDIDDSIGDGLTDNFIIAPTGLYTGSVVYVDNVYDLTNDRPLQRKSIRYMNTRNPDDLGLPRIWSPAGTGQQVGFYVHPRPGVPAEVIGIRNRTYNYPPLLSSGGQDPIIPGAWHKAIWLASVAEGAQVIDWPEKALEYEQLFMQFIAERRSPVEESGAAGGRRHFTIGGLQWLLL